MVGRQILSLLFSFLYGVFDYYSFHFFRKRFKNYNIFFKIIYNVLFMIFNVFLYVLLLYYINSGVFNIYFLLLYLFGAFIGEKLYMYTKRQL